MKDTPPLLFDTHVHLDAAPLAGDPGAEARMARQAGVGCFVVPGVGRAEWPRLLSVVQSVDGAWAAPGLHPLAAADWSPECERELQSLQGEPSVVAVGEIGLDLLFPSPSLELQERAFRGQLRLAVAAGRPVLIHCRKATQRLLRILREEAAERVGGILHAFSGSLETAREALRLGFAIGIGGPVTYPGARRLLEVVREVPAEWLVLETDAPDLAPHPHRGEVNHPAWLALTARRVAELRGWSDEETARITTANAKRVFRLSDA